LVKLIKSIVREKSVTCLTIILREDEYQNDKKKHGGCVLTDINKYKIKNWKERSNNRADWEKSIMEAKASNGL